jgi:hypothetical protein
MSASLGWLVRSQGKVTAELPDLVASRPPPRVGDSFGDSFDSMHWDAGYDRDDVSVWVALWHPIDKSREIAVVTDKGQMIEKL